MKTLYTLLTLAVLGLNQSYAQTTQVFTYTGSMQTFVVPSCVNEIAIDAMGAQGGNGTPMFGGLGARIVGTCNVTPGDIITILVGGQGQSSSNSGGGGGGSFIYNQTKVTLLVAAGGGGGGGNQGDGDPGQAGTSGTDGHNNGFGTGGSNGGGGGGASGFGTGGGGGYCGDGGSGTIGVYANGGIGGSGCVNGSDGVGTVCTVSKGMSFLNGGAGGTWSACVTGGGNGGFGGGGAAIVGNYNGGGGGGYSGGGGSGGNNAPLFLGGGGGGSFNGGTFQSNTAGFQIGNGQVIFTYTFNLPITFSQSPVICAGQSITVGSNTYTTSGTYIDTLTAVNTCDSIVTTNLTVTQSPVLTTSVSALTITSNQNGATYQWVDCNNSNLPIAGATNQVFTVTVNGSYAVIVTLNGCSDTSACVNISSVGVAELSSFGSQVFIYPNPFSFTTTLQTDHLFKNATLTVYNSFGQAVKQIKNINGHTVTLSRDDLASGLYFIRLTEENKTSTLDKLVITDK